LAYGGLLAPFFAEVMGKENGLCGGRGGSQHIHYKNFFSNGIQGGIVGNATGIALSNKLDQNNSAVIDSMIDYNRDYLYDYFGFKTLEKSYLLKSNGQIIERPQDMLMRTAITLQQGNLELIKKTYDMMSYGYYTHASPTLYNSGTNHMQCSSCFVANTEVMTINGIKNIQDIEIGDEVVTHTGEKHQVLQLHKNLLNDRKVMKLSVYKTKPIYVTEDHKFWAISKSDLEPKWRPIKELNNNDHYVAIPSYNGNLKSDVINSIKIDESVAKLMGIFIVLGKYVTENDKIIGIAFLKQCKFISDTMKVNFNIDAENHKSMLIFKEKNIATFLEYMFGIDKHIWKNMVNWNINLITSFLEGLFFASDGYDSSNSSIVKLPNQKITNELYHLFRMFGINVGASEEKNQLHFYDNTNQIVVNNVKFIKIYDIEETNMKPEYVYTIGVENDHSYNVEGLICENCFLLGTNDDLSDIATTWNSCAQISKWAGGIGLHVSNIRGKGSLIKGTNGLSNGLVPFLRVFNDIARWIDQGGKRPGSIAIYLEPHHPDIFEFLDLRKNFGAETERARDLFLALWISDLFMKQVEADGDWYLLSADDCPGLPDVYGDAYEELYWKYVNENKFRNKVKARKVWMAILESQIETGMPYISYKDAVNHKSNQINLGTIKSSNLCVHGKTKILTSEGYEMIETLENKECQIWNGDEWSKVTVLKTGTNQNLIRVNLSNGVSLDCTPEHKFYILKKDPRSKPNQVHAKDLKIGNKLIKYNLPEPIENKQPEEFKYAYTHGAFCGDGTTYDNYSKTEKYPKIFLYGEKKKLLKYLEHTSYTEDITQNRYNITLPKDLAPKFTVPHKASINDKLRWFEGYCDTDGTIARNKTPKLSEAIQICSINKNFLLEVRLMLHTLGVDSKVTQNQLERQTLLPDGKGDNKLFDCKPAYRLLIPSNSLYKLSLLGFKPKRLIYTQREPDQHTDHYIEVVSIESSYQNVDTYCFTEPLKHMGMFNGVLSCNCNEIVQYSDHNEYAVCNLASIALKPFVETWTNNPDDKWIVYTKPNCKFCKFAKNFLINSNILFQEKEFNNDNLSELKEKLKPISAKQNVDCLGQSCKINSITFPQIFMNDNHIGGWTELYKYTKGTFDYDKLYDTAYLATINLNQVIDINYYPVPQTKLSNMKHRPIGLGIQGLADALVLMGISFDSDEAVDFNSKIMETIYLAAMTASNNLAVQRYQPMKELISYLKDKSYPEYYESNYKIDNEYMNNIYHQLKPNKYELVKDSHLESIGAYSTFVGSPLSEGKFQFDLWDKKPLYKEKWDLLREKVIKYGTRNSLLTALMPTASTSQILGNNECFEFFSNNIYTRKTQAGDFVLVNKYLVNDLLKINMWSPELKDKIIAANGSIQMLDEVPPNIKQIYKTMWEIKQIWVLRGATARGPFVDQTQSMNIFMAEPDYQRLTSSHFWGWKHGLKTGMYYLRSKPSADAIKFTIDPKLLKAIKTETFEGCENCSA
jgi:ribonucleotide reductase alpha subunit